jgi:hypothetical protein
MTVRGGIRTSLVAAFVVLLAASGCATDHEPVPGQARRVLVVTLPGVTWRDVDERTMPALRELAGEGAVANVANRLGRRQADAASAYLTMSSGTRAFAVGGESGLALAPGELVDGVDASGILARRLGRVPEGISYPAAGPTLEHNDDTVYGARIGMLGDALEAGGVHRAVVANADWVDELDRVGPTGDVSLLHREAAALLMGSDGSVPGGDVSRSLLRPDPALPFGVGLDPRLVEAAVGAALDEAGDRQVVVTVEASDLRREARYRRLVTPSEQRSIRRRALQDADALIARLAARLDPAHDALVVVGIPTSPSRPELGVALLWGQGTERGLLRSATTGRDGYVQLADVAPALLDLFGLDHPDDIEGRPFAVTADGDGGRVRQLGVDVLEAGFRDSTVPVVTITFIAALALLLVLSRPWSPAGPHRRRAIRFGAYTILGAAAGTFLAGVSWLSPASVLPYAATVVGIGVVVGATALLVDEARPGWGVLAALGSVVLVIAVDVLAGATLQVNTVFGYSVAVAGRFVGVGNLAFALFSAAALLFAALLAERFGRRGLVAGAAVLLAVVVIDGLPHLGADVGGSLAMVPAFGATLVVLAGRRVGVPQLVALGAAGAGAMLLFALVDLSRPAQDQTHLARFARTVLDGEWAGLAGSLGRRLQASFGSYQAVAAASIVAALAVTVLYVVLRDRGRWPAATWRDRWPVPVLAAVTGLAILAVLGWTANDSSGAVSATMLIVVVPVVVDRLSRRGEVGT